MNDTILQKMKEFREKHGAKKALFTAEEWSEELGMVITPQRLGSMYRAGLVVRVQDKRFYGDNKCRYDIVE